MDARRSLPALIGRHFAPWRKSRRTTLTVLVFGLLLGRRLGLAAIARRMAGGVSVRHKIKRVGRFADNKGVRLQEATPCLVDWVLCLSGKAPVVALDWTALARGLVMLTAAVGLGGRAVPVAWLVMGRRAFTRKRKSRNDAEEELILRLKEAFGGCRWLLVADRGFARADLFAKLRKWGIRYVIRACGNPWVDTGGWSGRLWDIPRRADWLRRYDRVLYHKGRRVPVSLVVVHRGSAPEPWYLITNAPGKVAIEKAYQRRWWIEEHFRDAKSGLGLSSLRVRKARRIERLLIVAAVAMLVAMAIGAAWRASHLGTDPQMTSHKRGVGLSVLNLGYELFRTLVIGALPLTLLDLPLPLAPEINR